MVRLLFKFVVGPAEGEAFRDQIPEIALRFQGIVRSSEKNLFIYELRTLNYELDKHFTTI
jgi:hypothetical protein